MKGIEIPFGAKDSELCGWEYTIPEGMEAVVEGGKVIVRRKESEDERIRKGIVEAIRQCTDILDPKNQKRMLTWLEKQKEQPMSAEEVLIRAGLKPYRDGNQWCVLAGGDIQEGICGFGDTIDEALYQFLMEVLKIQKEQQPAEWSAEDEIRRESCISYLANTRDVIEFSQYIGNNAKESGKKEIQKDIDWLKSLHPSWKPSEEQMEALNVAVGDYNAEDTASCEKTADILESLYTDLQKLF